MADLRYPLDFTLDKTELDIIRSAILSVLLTQTGERPMLPEYGVDVDIFDTPNTSSFIAECEKAVAKYLDYGDFKIFGRPTETGWYLLVVYNGLDIELDINN